MTSRTATEDKQRSIRPETVSRYFVVSLINIFNHQTILWLANSVWGWSGASANALAACISVVPAYILSRTWVWEKSGNHSVRQEVLPFWLIAITGLVVSSAMAEAVDRTMGSGIWVNVSSLVGYFIVWVAKFFLLNRLFTRDDADESSSD